jgi:hypothetical protein
MLLRPALRYSILRDAYVVIGDSYGPLLQRRRGRQRTPRKSSNSTALIPANAPYGAKYGALAS